MKYNQYTFLSHFYDLLNDEVDYDGWFEFINSNFIKHSLKPASVLDLACGTGEMAIRFAKAGIETIAVDLSNEMLSIAKQKADEKELDILFLNWF